VNILQPKAQIVPSQESDSLNERVENIVGYLRRVKEILKLKDSEMFLISDIISDVN